MVIRAEAAIVGGKFSDEPRFIRLPVSSAFWARTKAKSGRRAVSMMYSRPSKLRRSLPSATTVSVPTGE